MTFRLQFTMHAIYYSRKCNISRWDIILIINKSLASILSALLCRRSSCQIHYTIIIDWFRVMRLRANEMLSLSLLPSRFCVTAYKVSRYIWIIQRDDKLFLCARHWLTRSQWLLDATPSRNFALFIVYRDAQMSCDLMILLTTNAYANRYEAPK